MTRCGICQKNYWFSNFDIAFGDEEDAIIFGFFSLTEDCFTQLRTLILATHYKPVKPDLIIPDKFDVKAALMDRRPISFSLDFVIVANDYLRNISTCRTMEEIGYSGHNLGVILANPRVPELDRDWFAFLEIQRPAS